MSPKKHPGASPLRCTLRGKRQAKIRPKTANMVVQEINYKRGLLEKKLFSSNFPAINLHLNHVHWGISRFSIFDYQKGSYHGTDQDPRGQIGSFVIYEITILGESTSSNIQHHPASTSYDLGYSLGF